MALIRAAAATAADGAMEVSDLTQSANAVSPALLMASQAAESSSTSQGAVLLLCPPKEVSIRMSAHESACSRKNGCFILTQCRRCLRIREGERQAQLGLLTKCLCVGAIARCNPNSHQRPERASFPHSRYLGNMWATSNSSHGGQLLACSQVQGRQRPHANNELVWDCECRKNDRKVRSAGNTRRLHTHCTLGERVRQVRHGGDARLRSQVGSASGARGRLRGKDVADVCDGASGARYFGL